MIHYKFREAIALAWIDPKTLWPNRMKMRNNIRHLQHQLQKTHQVRDSQVLQQERKT